MAAETRVGSDCLMLAPTRELNQRARAVTLNGDQPDVEVPLSDGNAATVGDVRISPAIVITSV